MVLPPRDLETDGRLPRTRGSVYPPLTIASGFSLVHHIVLVREGSSTAVGMLGFTILQGLPRGHRKTSDKCVPNPVPREKIPKFRLKIKSYFSKREISEADNSRGPMAVRGTVCNNASPAFRSHTSQHRGGATLPEGG